MELKNGMTVVDGTLGGAGHSREMCEAIGKDGVLVGLDRDRSAIDRSRKVLAGGLCKQHFFVSNFKDLPVVLSSVGIEGVDAVLLDLGFSSFQIDGSGRGFSFLFDEPLVMTLEEDISHERLTASEIVNDWSEESLADIIYGYGGERYARRIARSIVEKRKIKKLETTKDLVCAIEEAVPREYKRKKIHFATKTFQAIRITVNDEIGSLKIGLDVAWQKLISGGRLAVISFHEIEDRTVKYFFRAKKNAGEGEIITKKPIVPSEKEIEENPRSRSAKLRIATKINANM